VAGLSSYSRLGFLFSVVSLFADVVSRVAFPWQISSNFVIESKGAYRRSKLKTRRNECLAIRKNNKERRTVGVDSTQNSGKVRANNTRRSSRGI
jgi:hypothetical protein